MGTNAQAVSTPEAQNYSGFVEWKAAVTAPSLIWCVYKHTAAEKSWHILSTRPPFNLFSFFLISLFLFSMRLITDHALGARELGNGTQERIWGCRCSSRPFWEMYSVNIRLDWWREIRYTRALECFHCPGPPLFAASSKESFETRVCDKDTLFAPPMSSFTNTLSPLLHSFYPHLQMNTGDFWGLSTVAAVFSIPKKGQWYRSLYNLGAMRWETLQVTEKLHGGLVEVPGKSEGKQLSQG